MKHKNQTKGLAANTRAAQLLARSRGQVVVAARPLKPPHKHVYVMGGCKICGAQP